MKRFFTNWKTSLSGVTVILGTVTKIVNGGGAFDLQDIVTLIGGVGLLTAKDGNVSGGTKMQDGGTVPILPSERKPDAPQ